MTTGSSAGLLCFAGCSDGQLRLGWGQGKRKAAQRTRRQLLEAGAELLEGAEGVGEEEEEY